MKMKQESQGFQICMPKEKNFQIMKNNNMNGIVQDD